MNKLEEYRYHYGTLSEMDPDEVVLELGLSTEDIMEAFPQVVSDYIHDNFLYTDDEDEDEDDTEY